MERRAFLETAGAAATLSLLTGACIHRNRHWPLRIGINDWIGYQVISAAQALGFWEKRDLQVDLIDFNNLEDATRALYRRGVDGTFTNLWDLLQLCQEEENIHPVVLWVTNISYGSDGIVARPPYRNVAELKGKRVAAKLGSVNQLILLEALQTYDLMPQNLEILNLSNEIAVQHLRSGAIDGAVLWQPLLGEVAQDIGGKIVHHTGQIDSLVMDVLAADAQVLKKRPEEFRSLIWVWLDVMQALQQRPREVFQVLAEKQGRPASEIAADYRGLIPGTLSLNIERFSQPQPLASKIQKIIALAERDPNHPKDLKNAIEVDPAFTLSALKSWQALPSAPL
ncbi:MAG: ABC transporter substrate-binding protein [Cyanobacteriota bacterium]|jgi:NitT/TauT family transport system substrate-binding protein